MAKYDMREMSRRFGIGESAVMMAEANLQGRIQGGTLAPPSTSFADHGSRPVRVAATLMWAHHDGYMSEV